MEFYTRYKPPKSPCMFNPGDSLTHQEFKQECDINFIVRRCAAGLMSPPVAPEPVCVDVSDVPADYQECLDRIFAANERFAALPSRIRDRFANDPARMLEWMRDPANFDEGVKLGLFAKPARVEEPAPASAPAEEK